jgi:hypothetical protein
MSTTINFCPNSGILKWAWSRERGRYMLCRDCRRWVSTPVLIAEPYAHLTDGRYVHGICGSKGGILGSESSAAKLDGDFDLRGMEIHDEEKGFIRRAYEAEIPASPIVDIPPYVMLDVWMALGGDSEGFDRMWAEEGRTPADTWSQLLAMVRGEYPIDDHNPPPGPEFEALHQQLKLTL